MKALENDKIVGGEPGEHQHRHTLIQVGTFVQSAQAGSPQGGPGGLISSHSRPASQTNSLKGTQ